MFESTREQDAVADALAEKYGRCRVEGRADGSALMVGMTEDVEMEYVLVRPDGVKQPAEHMRPHGPARIVTQPPKQALGYKVIRDGKVRPCADLAEVAACLRHCLMAGKSFQAKACVSLTRDRSLTVKECHQVLALAAPKALAS